MTSKELLNCLKGRPCSVCKFRDENGCHKWNCVFEIATDEELNKGEWKKISPAGIYECSCCGQNVMTSDIECYKFCHGCGASMRAKE